MPAAARSRIGRGGVLLAALGLAICLPSRPVVLEGGGAAAQEWGGQLELGGYWGSERSLGFGKAMVPLWQNERAFWFADLRGRFADDDSTEFSLGSGYRRLVDLDLMGDDRWAAGGYLFADRLMSTRGNTFLQATLGVELLSERWDVRANGYLPESGEQRADSISTLDIAGGELQVRAGRERALWGFDGEIGYKLPLERVTARVFAGGYHFEAKGFDSLSGPRGRIELTLDDRQWSALPAGFEITLGGEVQHDDVRDTQGFALLELRVPFGRAAEQRTSLAGAERRMMDFPVRDIDVVTNEGLGAAEPAVVAGRSVDGIVTLDADDDVAAEVAAAAENTLVLVDGSAGRVDLAAPVELQPGQVLLGAGQTVAVEGARSGARFRHAFAGERPRLNGIGGIAQVVVMADRATLAGVDITGDNLTGILVEEMSDVAISNVALDVLTTGVSVVSSSEVTISDTQVVNAFSALSVSNIGAGLNSDITISDVRLTDSDTGIFLEDVAGVTVERMVITDSAVDGLVFNDGAFTASDVTLNQVTIDGAAGDAFKLQETITGLAGSGNRVTGTIGGEACASAGATVTGSFVFNDTATCP